MERSAKRALLLNLLLAALSLLLVATAAEVALRLLLSRGLNPFEPDATIGFRLKSSFDGVYPRVAVRTDTHGHRVPVAQEQDSTGRYLFIGDSVTFGFSVAARDAYPVHVAMTLSVPEDATNAAVPGYNLEQAMVLAREQIARRRPDWVLYGLVINDIGQSQLPGRYADIDPHAARRDGWLSSSYLVSFVERRFTRIRMRFLPDEEEGGDGGAAAGVTSGGRDPHELPAASIEAFDRQWRELEVLQAEQQLPVYVLICPYAQQVDGPDDDAYQRFVLARCTDSDLTCLDPLAAFRSWATEPMFTGGSSYHYNERGHALLADWIVERLAETAAR